MTGQDRRAAESAAWQVERRDDLRPEHRDVAAASDEAPVPLVRAGRPAVRGELMSAVRTTLRAVIVAGLAASAVTLLLGLGHVAAAVERFGQATSYADAPRS